MTTKSSVTLSHRIVSQLGSWFLYFTGKSGFHWKMDHPSYLAFRRDKKPCLYAFWHNTQVFLAYAHRGEMVSIIVSQSKDGEYIAQVMKKLGLKAVRGSSSRGGAAALRELLKLLKTKEQIAVSPDGPKGPLHSIQPGIVWLAKRSRLPIVATSADSTHRLQFKKSWDGFMVPLPFASTVVVHGKPFTLSPDDDESLGAEKIKENLEAVRERAERWTHEGLGWWGSLIGGLFHFSYMWASFIFSVALPAAIVKYGWSRSKKGWSERLGLGLGPLNPTPFWFHAASVGEWRALAPILNEFKKKVNQPFVITVSTPEAQRIITKDMPDMPVRLMPLDWGALWSRWLKKIQPQAFITVESEIWPTLFNRLYKSNIPIFIVNARMSTNSIRHWKWVYPFAKRLGAMVSGCMARTNQDAEHFKSFGVHRHRIVVTGNAKADNLILSEKENRTTARSQLLGNFNGVVLVGGSTWPGEEKMLLKLKDFLARGALRIFIAPRRLKRIPGIIEDLKKSGVSWELWSDRKKNGEPFEAQVVLVDTIGELNFIYRAADIVFVGGTLYPRGGQNPLEPAAAGAALIFGPSNESFLSEFEVMRENLGGFCGNNENEILQKITGLLNEPNQIGPMGEAAQKAVKGLQGGAAKTVDHLIEKLGLDS